MTSHQQTGVHIYTHCEKLSAVNNAFGVDRKEVKLEYDTGRFKMY